MAVTMRTFLQGLVAGAGQASNTMLQYIQYRDQMGLMERELAMKSMETEASVEQSKAIAGYYGELTSTEKMKQEEIVAAATMRGLQEDYQRLLNRGQANANEQSVGKYLVDTYETMKRAEAVVAQTKMFEANTRTAGLQNDALEISNGLQRVYFIAGVQADPKLKTYVIDHLDDKFPDIPSMATFFQKAGGKILTPEMNTVYQNLIGQKYMNEKQFDNVLFDYTQGLTNAALTGDNAKQVRKALGAKDESEVPTKVKEYITGLRSVYDANPISPVVDAIIRQGVQGMVDPSYDFQYIPYGADVGGDDAPPPPPPPDYSDMTPEERLNAQFQSAPGNVMLDRLYNRTVGQEVKQPYLMNQY